MRPLLALLVCSPNAFACAPGPTWIDGELGALVEAEDLELLMLDPGEDDGRNYGAIASHRTIGRVAITDATARAQLVGTLDAALRPGTGRSKCFYPRHALRGTTDFGVVEVVVCFECKEVFIGARGQARPVPLERDDTSASAAFEQLRIAAALPIAP